MSDTSGHVATERDMLHTITLRELETKVAAAGVLISRRQLMRHCAAGTFEAKKLPAANNVAEWFIIPSSIEKGVADIKTLQEQRARRVASRPVTSGHDGVELSLENETDTSGHSAPKPDMTDQQPKHAQGPTEPVMTRHVATDLDIYEHPYVKKLEDRVEKLESKYEAQVRRTEEIQLKGQAQLLELQRMTAVGQSQTLADFMLKARDWVLGQGSDQDKTTTTPLSTDDEAFADKY